MMIEIVKDRPIPPKSNGGNGGRKWLYPFALMEIGDSFSVPDDKGKTTQGGSSRQNSVLNCAIGYSKKCNPTARFTTRLVGEEVVCWRVA